MSARVASVRCWCSPPARKGEKGNSILPQTCRCMSGSSSQWWNGARLAQILNSICSPCYCLQTTEYAARAMMLSILQNYFRQPLFFSERGVGIKHSAVNIVGNQCKSKKIWQPHSRYTEVGLYLPAVTAAPCTVASCNGCRGLHPWWHCAGWFFLPGGHNTLHCLPVHHCCGSMQGRVQLCHTFIELAP